MDLTEIRTLGVLGIVVLGLVTTVGAVALSFMAAAIVHMGLTFTGWVSHVRRRAGEGAPSAARERTAAPPPRALTEQGHHPTPTDHALLARQAWWRLRC